MPRRLLAAAILCALARPAAPCTTFCLRGPDGRVVFGKNYDWNVADGLVMVNKRGAAGRWTARYGSVTFNQYGRGEPNGGMNEAGLVVELMWADGSRYPDKDARLALDCLEWIQYQLDTATTVADVIANDAKVRIESDVPLHYLVADRSGAAATIEFLGGKLVAHRGADLPVAALTNDSYAASLRFAADARGALPGGAGSLPRFARAADRVRKYRGGDPVAYAFATLDDVHSDITQWSIVYELDRGRIHFRTRGNPRVRTIALAKLDLACGKPALLFDLAADAGGDVTAALAPYTRAANLRLIRSSFAQTEFLAKTPAAEMERLAAQPDALTCR